MSWKLDDDETFQRVRKPQGRGDANAANSGKVKRRLKDARGHKKKRWHKPPRGRRFGRFRGAAAIVAALSPALMFTAPAHATWTYANNDPASIVSDYNGRDFTIKRDRGYAGYYGQAFVGGLKDTVWLSHDAFVDARRGGGAGLLVLLHEIGHTLGIANERQATCFALAELRPVLRAYFGVTDRATVRARMRAAHQVVESAGPDYSRGACLPVTS